MNESCRSGAKNILHLVYPTPQVICKPLETIALLLFAWVALLWARRSNPSYRGARTNLSIWMGALLSLAPLWPLLNHVEFINPGIYLRRHGMLLIRSLACSDA